jgi:predicted transcriptional regulator
VVKKYPSRIKEETISTTIRLNKKVYKKLQELKHRREQNVRELIELAIINYYEQEFNNGD